MQHHIEDPEDNWGYEMIPTPEYSKEDYEYQGKVSRRRMYFVKPVKFPYKVVLNDNDESEFPEPMSSKAEQHTRWYNSIALYEMVHNSQIVLNFGGLHYLAEDLAKAGWTCRITYNPYGGRTKVVFNSADRRSTLCFRVDRSKQDFKSNDHALLKRLGEGTFNIVPKILVTEKVIQKEVVTEVVKEVITEEASDFELLDRVNQNIQKRLKARPKRKAVPTEVPQVMKAAS